MFTTDLMPEECPVCGSNHTRSVDYTNYHKCEDCSAMWGFNEGDPDYEEDSYIAQLPNEDDEHIADLIRREERKEEEEANVDRLREYDSQLENF